METVSCWRVFPFNKNAKGGEPFSKTWIPKSQGAGRFDIPDLTHILYLAETQGHAIAEVLQGLRNQTIDEDDLIRFGHPLSLVDISFSRTNILDLCDPGNLQQFEIRPDSLASWDFIKTRAISRQLFASPYRGFRWWSSLSGDWHSTVLFSRKWRDEDIQFGNPQPLSLDNPALLDIANRMAIRIKRH